MPDDIFGRCNGSPALLPRLERIALARRVVARLQAHRDPATRWLAAALARWFEAGGDFADALKIAPARGARETVQVLIRRERRDLALLELAAAAGSDRLALQMLRGEAPAAACAALVREARALGTPCGPQAVSRARARMSKWGR